MIRDVLNLLNEVQIGRVAEAIDSYGNVTATTSLTTLGRAAIYQAGSTNAFVSEKITRNSTHILVTLPGEYTWVTTDDVVVYNGDTYRVTGRADDVLQRGEIMVVGLELLE